MLRTVLPRPNARSRWLLTGRAEEVHSSERAPQLDDGADTEGDSEMGDQMSEDDEERSPHEGAP